MKFTLPFLSIITFCTFFSYGQADNGYYGKKGFIQVQSLMNYPMFYNVFSGDNSYSYTYAQENNRLVQKKDNFNTGFRVSAGYAVKRNIALIFEYGQDFSSVYLSNYASVNIDGYDVHLKHEMLDIGTSVFMPIIEFGSAKSLLPMGLSHQIGLGIAFSKVKEKDYMFQYDNYYGFDPTFNTGYQRYSTSANDPIDLKNVDPVKKYVFMYGLSMRSPITKSLMINYGIKYTLNIGSYQENYAYNPTNEEYLRKAIYRQRSYSFINLNVGLAFAF